MKQHIFIIDTSALLSGKPLILDNAQLMTTPLIEQELKPGGRDYRSFQFLKEKGLIIITPSQHSIKKITEIAKQTGDIDRLSTADIELLALALDIHMDKEKKGTLISDDYSIQNVAKILNINYQSIVQRGILQTYKWRYQCPGCKKTFTQPTSICPICGTETKLIKSKKT